jgi:hypothetical protein
MSTLPTNIETLAEHAEAIRVLGKRVVGDVIEIGRRLTEAKKLAGHGGWLPWLEREFGWEETTARRFINVYDLAGKSGKLPDLPVSCLYLLARPSTPADTRDAIIEMAETGEKLTHAKIKEMIDAAKTPKAAKVTTPIESSPATAPTEPSEEFQRHILEDHCVESFVDSIRDVIAAYERIEKHDVVARLVDDLEEQEDIRDAIECVSGIISDLKVAWRRKMKVPTTAEAPPTVPEQVVNTTALPWSGFANGFVTTIGSVDFKITAASRDGAVTHYTLMVKAKGADWSTATVIDRFKTLEAAKAAAQQHAAKAEAV